MPLGSNHMTLKSAEQAITYPGQAHFAIPAAKRHCFECDYWDQKSATNNKAVCFKAAQMMRRDPPKVPRNALICKYFEERK